MLSGVRVQRAEWHALKLAATWVPQGQTRQPPAAGQQAAPGFTAMTCCFSRFCRSRGWLDPGSPRGPYLHWGGFPTPLSTRSYLLWSKLETPSPIQLSLGHGRFPTHQIEAYSVSRKLCRNPFLFYPGGYLGHLGVTNPLGLLKPLLSA